MSFFSPHKFAEGSKKFYGEWRGHLPKIRTFKKLDRQAGRPTDRQTDIVVTLPKIIFKMPCFPINFILN